MTERSSKIEDFRALKPREFSVLKTMTMSQGPGGYGSHGEYEQSLSFVLARGVDHHGKSLFVEFFGVRDCTFKQPDLSVVNIDLQIIEGSSVPEAYRAFVVQDLGHEEVIWFQCRDFEAYLA